MLTSKSQQTRDQSMAQQVLYSILAPMPESEIKSTMQRISDTEKTRAFSRYARTHGYYVRTVRTISSLRRAAIIEWLTSSNDPRLAIYQS